MKEITILKLTLPLMMILPNSMYYLSGNYDVGRGLMMIIMAIGAWILT